MAEFPGARGWGYDGVYISAAQSSYGGPDGLARLVDAAHGAGLGVILDVVYNHVGASGDQALAAFGPYFTDKYGTFWGEAINYDDADCDPVREWVLQSAEGWVRDFHVDGLRLDAIHAIFDGGARHILRELADRVHAVNPRALVIAESGLNDPKVMRPPDEGGWGHDAPVGRRLPPRAARPAHRRPRRLLRGVRRRRPAREGLPAPVRARRRPTRRSAAAASARPPATARSTSSSSSARTTTRSATARSATACRPRRARSPRSCTLLSPFVPMLFMGEEHGEQAPFQFFTDHIDEEIAEATREGRRREFAVVRRRSPARRSPTRRTEETFQRSKLTRRGDPALRGLYERLLALRRELPAGVEVDAVDFDEDAPWLRVRRGPWTLAAQLRRRRGVACRPARRGEVVLATHDARLDDGAVVLPAPRGGAAAMSDARAGPASRSRSARRGTDRARTSRSSPRTPTA